MRHNPSSSVLPAGVAKTVAVSAIITTYNRRHFLKEAIESVLAQDFQGMETIVVDDGSDDGSFEVVRAYPVRYVYQPNRGVSAARNRGIALSRGQYIAFLDVDDLWRPGKIARQVGAIESEGAALCYTDEVWIKDGRWVNQGKRHAKFSGRIFERCLPLCIISPSSALIRREVFEEVGVFDEAMTVCEDYDMWLRITNLHAVIFLGEKFIVKRAGHGDQLSRRYTGMDRFRIESLAKLLRGGELLPCYRAATQEELRKKCAVYGKGAGKRGRAAEADYYRGLVESLGRGA